MIHSNDALQWCNTYKWFISKVGEPPCGRCRPAAEAPPVRFAYSPFTSVWCSNILSIPQLSLRLIESENQTVWRAASCSNRGQVVRRCHLKAALMVSVKWTPAPTPCSRLRRDQSPPVAWRQFPEDRVEAAWQALFAGFTAPLPVPHLLESTSTCPGSTD